jgi:hypothetical protein
MMRDRRCLGTGQTGVTGNVLLARLPTAFTHDAGVNLARLRTYGPLENGGQYRA